MCRVVNLKNEEYDVYIGRGSKYGNPFIIGKDGTRKEVIEKYRTYLKEMIWEGTITKSELRSLEGKRLGCFCKPKSCHGDVLKEFVNMAIRW